MKNEDVKLIHRILAGDESAFVDLVNKHQKQVHALAWRKIGDFHIAEEITQDTFLKVYQKLSTLKDPNQFSGWLYVIATRQCLSWLRKKRVETESLEDTDTQWIDETAYSRYVAEEHAKATTEAQREVVKKLLAKLKESERTVMTLHYLGEMTIEEISRFLGVSTSAIKLRLHRARQRLKKEEPMIREAQGYEILEDYTKWELPKGAKTRFGKGGINVIQFSPDGTQLAVGSRIGVWLYDMETGKELSMFPGPCKSIAFSPDGRFLANQGPQLWEMATGRKVVLADYFPHASVLRFSEDSKTLFALSNKGDSIRQLDVKTGKGNVKQIEGRTNWDYKDLFALTHDKLAVGTETKIELWDTATGEILSTLKGNMRVLALEFSPDGTRLASAGRNNDETVPLQLWDTDSKESILLDKHTGWVHALAFSSDGKMLASGGTDKMVQLWDIVTGEPLTTFTGHTNGITALTFSHDNRTLASGSADGTVQFWNIKTGNSLPSRITGHTMRMEAGTFFKDKTTLASVAYNGVISLWNVKTSQKIDTKTLPITDFYHKGDQDREYQDWLSTSAFSPDGAKIASAGAKGYRLFPSSSMAEYTEDGLIRLSDVRTGHELQTFATQEGPSYVTFSPDGKTVAFGVPGKIRVWNTETDENFDIVLDILSLDTSHLDQDEINKMPHHIQTQISAFESKISALVFSPDGKKLVSATHGGKVEMWDAKTGVSLARLFEGKGPIVEGTPPDISIAYQEHIGTLTFSPNGNLLAVVSYESVRLLRLLADNKHTLLKEMFNSASANTFVFSPDNTSLVTGLYGGEIELWNLETEDKPTILEGHTETVQTLVFSPDGKTLVSTGQDGTILLWDWDEVLKDSNREENK